MESPKNSGIQKTHHAKTASYGIELAKLNAVTSNSNRAIKANAISTLCLKKFLKDKQHAIQLKSPQTQRNSLTRKNSTNKIKATYNYKIQKNDKVVHFVAQLGDPIYELRANLIRHIAQYIIVHDTLPQTTSNYYQIIKVIGKGAFGVVSLGRHILTGKQVAIKTIEKACLKDKLSKKKVFQEIYILKKVRHNNVIKLLEVFETTESVFIVMEYAEKGDLFDLLKNKGSLPEDTAFKIFRQLVYGIAHIHSRYVLHRDIKLDNILLDSKLGVKICDFGVSKIIANEIPFREQCGTPAYMAPEIIENKGYTGFSSDLWSLGVLLYSMLTESIPFKSNNLQELLMVIKCNPVTYPFKLSRKATDIIEGLLRIKASDRLTLPEVLNRLNTSKIYDGEVVGYENCFKKVKEVSINELNVGNVFINKHSTTISSLDYSYIIGDYYSHHIDHEAVKITESFGYPIEIIKQTLQSGELNQITATYSLLTL